MEAPNTNRCVLDTSDTVAATGQYCSSPDDFTYGILAGFDPLWRVHSRPTAYNLGSSLRTPIERKPVFNASAFLAKAGIGRTIAQIPKSSVIFSQGDLADKVGVSFQQVQMYERGAHRVADTTLVAASDALGTPVGWLVGEEASGRHDDEHAFRALARPGALEILQAFNAIADLPARMALRALLREMAASSSEDRTHGGA